MNKQNNVLKLDRDSTIKSQFQKDFYKPNNPKEEVGTRFSLDIEKRAQASHMKVKLDHMPKDGEVVYTASKKFDSLLKLEAHINLSSVKVKEQYKNSVSIAYHHNIAHHVLYSGECKIDNEHYGFLDSIWLDINSEYFISKRKLYKQMIGAIPCLENWNTELPGLSLISPQPYFFTRNSRVALPILKSSNNTITFEYKLRTKLSELLKMRILTKGGEYKEVKCNLKYLDIKSPNIPVPELWGRYSEMTDEERNWRKSIDETTGEPRKQIIYIEDIESTESKNPKSIGTKEEIPLAGPSPVRHIFFVATLADGNLSNYTTNRNDLYKGWNPCAKSGIKYGTSDRVEEIPHEHFDLSEAYDFNWPNFPREAGYNVFTYTFNPMDIQNADSAVILKECGATLNILLGDTNPFVNQEEEEEHYDEDGSLIPVEALTEDSENKKDRYIVHVRTVIVKKLEVSWNDKSDSLKYIFTTN